MRSPFPGMDPYLEQRWSDVHSKLIAFIGEALQSRLPSALRARAEERVLLEGPLDQNPSSYHFQPDVATTNVGRGTGRSVQAAGGVAVAEPDLKIELAPITERKLVIVDRTNRNRLITVIEIVSRWNKGPGTLNEMYCQKVEAFSAARVSVVEIDLLREPGRERLPMTLKQVPPERRAPYFICVTKPWDRNLGDGYSIGLREPLPTIAIPLRGPEEWVPLELQPIIERVYTAGGHDDIDYTRPCEPPLTAEDAEWADELLKTAGKR